MVDMGLIEPSHSARFVFQCIKRMVVLILYRFSESQFPNQT